MELFFDGEAVDVSVAGVLWQGDIRPISEIPEPVRHAAGYDLFVAHVRASGEDPAALAADTRSLARYLYRHRASLAAGGGALLDSAGIFLGNGLIARASEGRWQHFPGAELEVAQGDGGGAEVLRIPRLLIEGAAGDLREFDEFLRQWDSQPAEALRRRTAEKTARRRLELRDAPVIPLVAFEPPADASVVDLLGALVAYLTTQYSATATRSAPLPDDPHTISPTVETIRVTPQSADGAPLVIAIDDVGALAIRAGAFTEFFFYGPNSADLEDTLLSIAAGLYRETYPTEPDGIAGYRLGSISRSGTSSSLHPPDVDSRRVPAITTQLNAVPDGWAPWPLRDTPDD